VTAPTRVQLGEGADGAILLPFTQAKQVLDRLKRLCIGRDLPDAGACARFDKVTKDGKDMRDAQDLLAKAVASIVGKKEERAVASLFTPGGTHAMKGEFQGTNDFEVVALLVVLWADHLNVPSDFRELLARPYSLAMILLGKSYLAACRIDAALRLGSPTLLFCGSSTAQNLPCITNLKQVILSVPETRRFSCGHVGLKGEVANRILNLLIDGDGLRTLARLVDPSVDVLGLLARSNAGGSGARSRYGRNRKRR